MADVYLTKVERKTIFTQSMLYVIMMMFFADMTVTGPYVICLIPLLYLMGIISISKFNHHLLTVIIASAMVFVASCFWYKDIGVEVIANTINAVITVTCGVITGICIKRFVLKHRLVLFMSPFQVFGNTAIIVASLIVALLSDTYVYGNLISYMKNRTELKEYLTKTYGTNYVINDTTHLMGFDGIYAFDVNIQDYEIEYVYDKSKKSFKDNNYTARIGMLNDTLATNIQPYVTNIMQEVDTELELKTFATYWYEMQTVVPSGIHVGLDMSCGNIHNMEFITDKNYEEILEIVFNIFKYEDSRNIPVSRVIVSLCNQSSIIQKEELTNMNVQTLKESFHVVEAESYMGTIDIN